MCMPLPRTTQQKRTCEITSSHYCHTTCETYPSGFKTIKYSIHGDTWLIPHRLSQNDNQYRCHLRSSFSSNYSFYNQKIHLYVVGTAIDSMICDLALFPACTDTGAVFNCVSWWAKCDTGMYLIALVTANIHSNSVTMCWKMGIYYSVYFHGPRWAMELKWWCCQRNSYCSTLMRL